MNNIERVRRIERANEILAELGGVDILDALEELRTIKLSQQKEAAMLSEDNGLPYSPKLKEVSAQINKILKDNDVAGLCILYTRGFGEFLNHLETRESVFRYEHLPEGLALRFKSKLEDFNGDVDAQMRATEYSVGYLRIVLDIMKIHMDMYGQVYNEVSKSMEIEHGTGILTTANPLN